MTVKLFQSAAAGEFGGGGIFVKNFWNARLFFGSTHLKLFDRGSGESLKNIDIFCNE